MNIPRDYLEGLNRKYLKWYNEYNLSSKIKFSYDDINIFNEEDKNKVISLIRDKLVL